MNLLRDCVVAVQQIRILCQLWLGHALPVVTNLKIEFRVYGVKNEKLFFLKLLILVHQISELHAGEQLLGEHLFVWGQLELYTAF